MYGVVQPAGNVNFFIESEKANMALKLAEVTSGLCALLRVKCVRISGGQRQGRMQSDPMGWTRPAKLSKAQMSS